MRRGMSYIIGFLVVFCLLVIIAMSVYVLLLGSGGLGDEPEFNYQVEGVTRFQSCDITLLSLLRTDTGEGYDFAEAISINKWDDVKEDAQKYVDEAIDDGVTIRLAQCVPGEICCSQVVPDLEGNSMEVSLVANE